MNKKDEMKIEVTDGPYIVSGRVPLDKEVIQTDSDGIPCSWQTTASYQTGEAYRLCRCGNSKNMPFCDNSHFEGDYNKEEVAGHKPYIENAERFEGPHLTLFDNYDLCALARFCDRAGTVWELVKNDDEQSRSIALEECANCPSGRLVACDKKTGKIIEPKLEKSISITEDPGLMVSGPIRVKGGIEICGEDGKIYEKRNRVTLCRCGKSKNMPFCDTSHAKDKFNDGDKSVN